MKLSYFADTDTLYIEFSDSGAIETRDLDENTLLDLDAAGNIVSLTMEHASKTADVHKLQISGIVN
ncbi:MAG: DUF2283 domain-containing protein [Proteobacteria bacterium]|jgi:uncharacterized protein YuzE|nr:DUF2283 domain-containing protein [Pseudomonadota bacterium]MDA0929268.1 DUF2283 domain-containing protein [Pseudomonadota bacterium]